MEQQPQFSHGTNQLTNTLKGIMGGIAKDAAAPQIDIGKINSDYSLTTNSFPRPIPQKEWSVCRSLLYDPRVPLTETFCDGEHVHGCGGPCPWPAPTGPHVHQVKLPKKMYWLRPGQKVLVAIIQNEFVVIDIIYDAKWLGKSEPNWE